jgi:CCR4-NOT transcription complex subunit 1
LDEARFFDQYPDNELLVTGELLGLLVEHHLISYAQLRVALKYILDAANTKVGSKMFNFGIQALLQFRGRYSEWPQYTNLLSKIDGLKGYPAIYDSITTALQRIGQREQEQGTPKDPTLMEKGNGKAIANGHDLAPDVSSLLGNPGASSNHEQPSTKIQERVSFLINNLSIGNMDTKCPELLSLLKPPTWPWFSHYLVVRRVSIEPNNHDLYMSLLNELDLAQLNEIIVEDTYSNIRMLLQSDTIVSSSADRKLLKNLAVWLGKMTIAKNKPIRHKDLSFKVAFHKMGCRR